MYLKLEFEILFVCAFQLLFLSSVSGKIQLNLGEKYDFRTEYSGSLSEIYSQYLSDKSLDEKCTRRGLTSEIGEDDLDSAFRKANKQLTKLRQFDRKTLDKNEIFQKFDSFLYEANIKAKYMEFATRDLINKMCLSKIDSVLNLNNISDSNELDKNQKFCELDSDVSPSVDCDSEYKYSRIDGKCNNLKNTNWGSAFHCQRRLLPPDFSDGVNQIRLSTDGSPLPNPRLLTKMLFREKALISNFTSLNTVWGQFIAHDTFGRILYSGGALTCCHANQSSHPECLPLENIPQDDVSIAYKQTCVNFMRTVACNSCTLGPRQQINQVTSFLDLSQVYGLTQSLSKRLRTFRGGQMAVDEALDGSDMLPVAKLPHDQDVHDFSKCLPPPDRPWLTCFRNGDGIRGNQNPPAAALKLLLIRRHNQHCRGLANVNPHWNDQKLFQEARRLLIAEYNQINFAEYAPANLPKDIMETFDLAVKSNGFTEYNPDVDPSGIQSVGAAAFRFGHMTTMSVFQVQTQPNYESYGFKLRDKFFEMSDIWDGRTNDLIKGLTEAPEKTIGPSMVPDLQDHLLMDRCNPSIKDLGAFNIQRGRDYGIPAYIYYLQYSSGVQITSWDDLKQFIPDNYIDKLKQYYNDYRDIDLFVGGVLEKGVKTFMYEMGLQFFHWKFGDRFYYEHSEQAGSFTEDQLNCIRSKASLANLLCKTAGFESIASKPLLVPSESNPRIFCKNLNDINYSLFQE